MLQMMMGSEVTMEFQSPPVPLEMNEQGVIRISGTRVSLDSVLYWHNLGASPEAIVRKFPVLPIADVYAVIGYYLYAPEQIDAYLRESERQEAELEAEIRHRFPQEGFREKLLARRSPLIGHTE
jgi:uncharacterized protein (DUF433 family)